MAQGSSSHLRRQRGLRWLGIGPGGIDTYRVLRSGRLLHFYPDPSGQYAKSRGRGAARHFYFPNGMRAKVVRGPRVTTVFSIQRPPKQVQMGSLPGLSDLHNLDGASLALGAVGLLAVASVAASRW